jgi:hypothetical protein
MFVQAVLRQDEPQKGWRAQSAVVSLCLTFVPLGPSP